MISDNRKNWDRTVKKYICPHCGSKERMIVDKDIGVEICDGKAYLYNCFCQNCEEFNSIYIDIDTKKVYTSPKEYYKTFPERYDLKKYLSFLVHRIDVIRQETQEMLENNILKVDKEIMEKIKRWNEICNFRINNRYSLLQELLLDPKDEKYIIDIKKARWCK